MKWGMVVAGVLAMSLAACSDQPSAPASDQELSQLVQRTFDLKDKVAAVGRMTAEHRVELARLERDVNAWQARTGRAEISVSTSRPVRDGRLAAVPVGGGSDGCRACPGYEVRGDKVCFLVEEGECPEPGEEGEIGFGRTCVYSCIYIGTIKPIKPKVPTGPIVSR